MIVFVIGSDQRLKDASPSRAAVPAVERSRLAMFFAKPGSERTFSG
jgi:hypothetical protein